MAGKSEKGALFKKLNARDRAQFVAAGNIEQLHIHGEQVPLSTPLDSSIPGMPVSALADLRTLRATTPNNLPRLQPFFNRSKELKQIREALDPSSPAWGVHIDGPGGRGKTSLAVRAANDCPPDRFQQFIFLSVKDREMKEGGEQRRTGLILRGALEMLNELARELGRPGLAKAPEDQRIRLLLEALRPVHSLLILDNLESLPKEDLDQVFTFVNNLPPGSKAILTSRLRIGSDSELLFLEPLDQGAELELIADLAEHNSLLAKTSEAERIKLCAQTGGNPLLLRWVAGQLGRGSCRTLSDALQFLCSCPRGNDPLEFIFGDLAQEFSEQEAIILSALTYFGLPARAKHIADVTGLSEEATRTAVRSLANRPLVVPDQKEETYALVPMVAEFLRKIRPELVAMAGDQLKEYAYMLVIENGDEKYDCFPVIEEAWSLVAAALPLFLAGPNARLQTVCGAIYSFLNFTGRWDELRSLNKQAEAAALVAADRHHAGMRAYHAGLVHHRRGESAAVLACADRAAHHWQDAPTTSRGPGLVAHLRGWGRRIEGSKAAAIDSFRDAFRHASGPPDVLRDVAIFLADLGDAELSSGDRASAESDLREALRISLNVGDRQVTAGSLIRLARAVLAGYDFLEAETLSREALRLSEEIRRQEFIADSCEVLAKSLLRGGKTPEALDCAQRAIDLYHRLDSPKAEDAVRTLRACQE